MISALHLLWIVPVTMLAGFILCSLLAGNKFTDEQRGMNGEEWWIDED